MEQEGSISASGSTVSWINEGIEVLLQILILKSALMSFFRSCVPVLLSGCWMKVREHHLISGCHRCLYAF